ncbi:hypothetical protein MFLAVUS_000004 [Mucor flavus]|uniref:DDE Tnp4 domain-containing protein n=1 Tax=Mucor flavus TaxID=439312 RepID=A0ABP9YII6_9FUNG
MVCGISINQMYDDLNDWINNLIIRLLTSYYKNPELAKHIEKKCIHGIVYVSESLPCRDHNDDLMFINNIEFKKFFTSYDNICFDGLYENTLLETIEKYKSNVDMDLSNFTYPINKTKNKDLEENEERFNRYIGGFRSTIESYFSFLGSTFKRFSGQNNIRVTKLKTYNVQLRLACLLLNIKQFSEVSNLNFNEKYSSWTRKSFDYPPKIGIIPKTEPIIFRFNSIEIMLNNNSLNDDIDIQNNNIVTELIKK